MTLTHFIFLLIAGVVAGLLSTIAGLASLASYPALLMIGVPPVIANVTNTAALVFTGIGATFSSLRELKGHWAELGRILILVTLGGIVGSIILLKAPASSFEKVVPFFIGASGVLLLISGRSPKNPDLAAATGPRAATKGQQALIIVAMFIVGAYTGYFGAAGGVIMLAILALISTERFTVINAERNVAGFASNAIATVIYSFTTHIAWLLVIPLGLGLLIGGYIGPAIVRRVPVKLLRLVIALAAFGLAIDLFIKAYF
ncbi:MAG: sulfite exporter TauE/SafE family protein [Schleiferilactobacillus perolens]|jgi:uncharacterized membrane protein YfcA|uniref:Probable membrane transporter protein n=1 Tax=Schleiferilactobacillus perolens DSM 12744 TaxID=1423792 RepID=A0A0R1MW80_9LACO|nr:sulfite exporter TauE/SafE family protein [Schleiferilactobacillus perolens]KRL12432.1 integral membrane protein [Schleiferilactobacillus perolens DSM 12744]MCI1891997.1 sulfite exporter TauE/SafE family protein [Schleiferilactobacillus harbinensis]MCI1913419.1 sulfite exporter TauE/SafE family protein [Schleiferilactobacillus harbinensis]